MPFNELSRSNLFKIYIKTLAGLYENDETFKLQ
jgi:hypothetical protein